MRKVDRYAWEKLGPDEGEIHTSIAFVEHPPFHRTPDPLAREKEFSVFELIVSPFLDEYLVLRPGSESGIRLPARLWTELSSTADTVPCPGWLVDAARRRWPDLDLSGRQLADVVLVRAPSGHAYGRASYELNLGCNYDCEHCYLGLKRFEGLSWPDRERLLQLLADAGVLWLQLTGGEPLIDKLFTEVYQRAFELGMMLSISSNGSRLAQPDILELLTRYRPYRLTISVYGATAEAYDGLTRRRGSFAKFTRGLAPNTATSASRRSGRTNRTTSAGTP